MDKKDDPANLFDDVLGSTNNVPNDQLKQLIDSLGLSPTSHQVSSDVPPQFVSQSSNDLPTLDADQGNALKLGDVNTTGFTEESVGVSSSIEVTPPRTGIAGVSGGNDREYGEGAVGDTRSGERSHPRRRGRKTHEITMETLIENFHLPRKVVERKLSIKRTAFTILRSRHGIRRWPYRLFRDVDNRIERNNERMAALDGVQRGFLVTENEKLTRIKSLIRSNPRLSRNGLTVDALLEYVSQPQQR